MINLLFKDLRISKQGFIIYGIMLFLILEVYSFGGIIDIESDSLSVNSIACVFYIMIYMIIIVNIFYIDFKNQSMLFLAAMPIKKKSLIISKYFIILCFAVAPIVLYLLNAGIQKLFHLNITVNIFSDSLFSLMLYMGFMIIAASIQLPIFYLFNYKFTFNFDFSINISGFLTILTAAISMIFFMIYKGKNIDYMFNLLNSNLVISFKNLMIILAISAVMYVISNIVSINILNKNDI